MDIRNLFSGFFRPRTLTGSQTIHGIGSAAAAFLDYEAAWFYKQVPEFRAIIDRQADMFLKPTFTITDGKGNPQKDGLTALLNKPNAYQDKFEFLSHAYKVFAVYDSVWYYLDNGGQSKLNQTSQIYCFAPSELRFTFNKQNFMPAQWKDTIKSVYAKVAWSESEMPLKLENLYFLNNSGLNQQSVLFGEPKFITARAALSNLWATYETENVLLNNRGPLKAISPALEKTEFGFIGMTPKELKDFEASIQNQYGGLEHQNRYKVFSRPISVQDLSSDLRSLALDESRQRNKIALCDIFGHDILLLNETSGSTYANLQGAQAGIYENTILPTWERFADFFVSNFAPGFVYEIGTDKIQSLRQDDSVLASTNATNTNTIINLNKAIAAGEMEKPQAVALLVSFGYTEELANEVINEYKAPTNGTNNQI